MGGGNKLQNAAASFEPDVTRTVSVLPLQDKELFFIWIWQDYHSLILKDLEY